MGGASEQVLLSSGCQGPYLIYKPFGLFTFNCVFIGKLGRSFLSEWARPAS